MLMNEVASAADTLELWKMINDSVWASLKRLEAEEKKRQASKSYTATKPNKKAGTSKSKAQPSPPFKPIPVIQKDQSSAQIQQQQKLTSLVQALRNDVQQLKAPQRQIKQTPSPTTLAPQKPAKVG